MAGVGHCRNEDEEARHYLETLRLGDDGEKVVAREGLAAIFERRGMLNEAAELYERNILAGERDRDLYQRLASIYIQQGKPELAEEVLSEARKLPLSAYNGHNGSSTSATTPSQSVPRNRQETQQSTAHFTKTHSYPPLSAGNVKSQSSSPLLLSTVLVPVTVVAGTLLGLSFYANWNLPTSTPAPTPTALPVAAAPTSISSSTSPPSTNVNGVVQDSSGPANAVRKTYEAIARKDRNGYIDSLDPQLRSMPDPIEVPDL